MSIANHVWGKSPEQDIIWSRVCGVDPERADRTLLMIWQGYFDESEKGDWFVLAGYLARVDQWAAFSAEWAKLARKYGKIDGAGNWHIHMSDFKRGERQESLSALKRTINDHVLMGVAVAMRPSAYQQSIARLVGFTRGGFTKLEGNLLEKPNLFAYELLLDCLSYRAIDRVHNLDQIDLENDRIEMIFDERNEERLIRDSWEGFKECRDRHALPNIFDAKPKFEDDKIFLPLQAADFLAYWVRERVDSGENLNGPIFPFGAKGKKRIPINVIVMDEEQLVRRWEGVLPPEGGKVLDVNKLVKCKISRPLP